MSQPATVPPTPDVERDFDPQRPYRHCSAIHLAEWVEIQYSKGEYDDALVIELATRALELEALKSSTAGT